MLFLLLRAEFVAAVQVVVYAGAVMVLYVFVVAYVGGEGETIGERLRGAGPVGLGPAARRRGRRRGAAGRAADRAARHGPRGDRRLRRRLRPGPRTFGTPAYIGKLLLTRFLLAFEVASFLLLVAAVGGVVLARRRRRPRARRRSSDACTPLDLLRPRGTGTMAEGVGTRSVAETVAGRRAP